MLTNLAAAQNNQEEVIKSFIGHRPTPRHLRAFKIAAEYGRDEAVELLFLQGISQAILDEALYHATDNEYETTVRLLLKLGADPNASGEE